jgi:acetylornithine deacetylase/succinyl-diaminopimelate desuccinylase-like protein
VAGTLNQFMRNSRPILPGVKSIAELTELRGVRECLDWFAKERQWINERHLECCRIPAPTFREQERAEWFVEKLRAIGCDAKIDRTGNVVAFPAGESEGPFVALTAHLDTVLAPRIPEEIHIKPDGRFYGPGVSDNGAGLAALLAVAAGIMASPRMEDLNVPLVIIANVGEEGEGNLSGMRYVCKQGPLASKIGTFLVLDGPNTDHITAVALASKRFEITLTGPGGHSWTDFGTGNPVHALSRAIAFYTENRANNGSQPGPRSSYNFGTIEGGLSINSIPTMAQAKLDLRSESAERLEALIEQLTVAVERSMEIENSRATAGRVSARIREIGFRPGGSLPDDAQVLSYLRAVDAHLGIRAQIDCASTDANIPLSLGLAAVSIGAGGLGGGAHTPAEWFSPEGREAGLRRILLTLNLLMRGAAAGQ